WDFRAGGIATRRPGGCGRPCRPATEGSYGGSAEDGERVNLDEEAGGQADVDGRAGGRGLGEALLLEVGVVQVVHLGEWVDVGEVDADHHHVIPGRDALLQAGLDGGESLEGLFVPDGSCERRRLAVLRREEPALTGDLEDV